MAVEKAVTTSTTADSSGIVKGGMTNIISGTLDATVDMSTTDEDDDLCKGQWFVLDFDGVIMRNQRPELFPQIKAVLYDLHRRGILLFLCSFNHKAHDILYRVNLLHLFVETLCDAGGPKPPQIAALAIRHGLRIEHCRFFDDVQHNVDVCTAAGIRSTWVDPSTGLTSDQCSMT